MRATDDCIGQNLRGKDTKQQLIAESIKYSRLGKNILQTSSSITGPINGSLNAFMKGAPSFYTIFENPSSRNNQIPLQNINPLNNSPLYQAANSNAQSQFPQIIGSGNTDQPMNMSQPPKGLSASAWVIITWALLAFFFLSMMILVTILYKKRYSSRNTSNSRFTLPQNSQFIVHYTDTYPNNTQRQQQPNTNRNAELAAVDMDGEHILTYTQEETEQAKVAKQTNQNIIAKIDVKQWRHNSANNDIENKSDSQPSKNVLQDNKIRDALQNALDKGKHVSIQQQNSQVKMNNGSQNIDSTDTIGKISNNNKNISNNNQDDINNSKQQNDKEIKNGMSLLDKSSLSSDVVVELEGMDMKHQCLICFEDYKNGEQIKQLRCSHTFHKHCVTEWFQSSNSCPVCRVTRQAEQEP